MIHPDTMLHTLRPWRLQQQISETRVIALRMSFVVAFLSAILFSSGANAQPPADAEAQTSEDAEPDRKLISAEAVEKFRQQVEAATDLEEDPKNRILETLKDAADAIAQAVKLEQEAPLNRAAIDKIAAKAAEIQAALSFPNRDLLAEIDSDASLQELTAELATRQPALHEAKTKLATLEAEPKRRSELRTTLSRDMAALAGEQELIKKELADPAPADELPLLSSARRVLRQARLRRLTVAAPAWQAELSRFDAEKAADLTALRIQLAKKDAAFRQQEVDELQKRITVKRSQDALYIADQLALFASGEAAATPYDFTTGYLYSEKLTTPADLAEAAETAKLAKDNIKATSQLTTATTQLQTAQKALDAQRTLRNVVDNRIERVGLTGAIGLELRRHLRDLADPREIHRRCATRQETMRELEFSRLELEDQTPELVARIDVLESNENRSVVEDIELRLSKDHLKTLTTLEKNDGELFDRLGELDAIEQEYIREIEEFSTFIRERVLWIRSHPLPNGKDFEDLLKVSGLLLSRAPWAGVGHTLQNDSVSSAWLWLLFAGLLLLLVGVRQRFRRNLTAIGGQVTKSTCREFQPTARAAVLTLVLSLIWPAFPAFLCWRLLSIPDATPFARAVGFGLLAMTAGFFTLNLLRQLCRPAGLGLAHFGWRDGVRLLSQKISTLIVVLLPLLFVENLLHAWEAAQGADALERLAFVASLLALAYFQVQILHPATGVFREFFLANPKGRSYRLRWPLFLIAVSVPLILVAMAILGFYYTAYELNWRLHIVTWALIGLLVVRSFLVRWYVLRHRELRIQQARLKRQALVETANASQNTSNIPLPQPTEAPVDLTEVSDQTQRLIDSGLAIVGLVITWFIWVDVLPALGILDTWNLWPTIVDHTVEYTDEGLQKFRTESVREFITVADALIAIVIGLLTFTAARNIPGLMEITLLVRLPLDASTRYAARMIARYSIIVIGLVSAFSVVGIGWAKVQWLAAGLTVGLGFGLQEIFANFVSGLIILFERPVRIGDVVTIGDVSGVVSRIQIRATTITDWDRKEYIVPNKEFVTGRLLNWTLSDQTNRIVIDVGVAYGTDTNNARSLLLEAAAENPNVMKDPGPIATFEGFGDSTLNLRLRCYLPNLDNRLRTITEVHESIDQKFKDAGIEISFPQRDLHIRTVPSNLRGLPSAATDLQSESLRNPPNS
jgi:potassium-dependent mechanosensitive channel